MHHVFSPIVELYLQRHTQHAAYTYDAWSMILASYLLWWWLRTAFVNSDQVDSGTDDDACRASSTARSGSRRSPLHMPCVRRNAASRFRTAVFTRPDQPVGSMASAQSASLAVDQSAIGSGFCTSLAISATSAAQSSCANVDLPADPKPTRKSGSCLNGRDGYPLRSRNQSSIRARPCLIISGGGDRMLLSAMDNPSTLRSSL